MSQITVQAEGFVNSIPTDPRTPGVFMGVSRSDVMKALFSLATEKGFSVNMAGQHWPEHPPAPLLSAWHRTSSAVASAHSTSVKTTVFAALLEGVNRGSTSVRREQAVSDQAMEQ